MRNETSGSSPEPSPRQKSGATHRGLSSSLSRALPIVSIGDPAHRRRWPQLRFWTWAHRLSALVFLMLIIFGRWGWIDWFQGSPTAARWFGVLPLMDPLAALEVALATGRLSRSMLLGAGVCLLTALLLGRVFCGWICPLGLLLELNDQVLGFARRKRKRVGWRIPEAKVSGKWPCGVLWFCLMLSFFASLPVFTMFSPINLLSLSLGGMAWLAAVVVLPIMVLEWFAPRVFCRALCPLGALYALTGGWAVLRVQVIGGERRRCGQCSLQCPMGIRVMEDHVMAGAGFVDDPLCTCCGTCTDVCLGKTLRLGFRRPGTILRKADDGSRVR